MGQVHSTAVQPPDRVEGFGVERPRQKRAAHGASHLRAGVADGANDRHLDVAVRVAFGCKQTLKLSFHFIDSLYVDTAECVDTV
jgi:hypothetical protein